MLKEYIKIKWRSLGRYIGGEDKKIFWRRR